MNAETNKNNLSDILTVLDSLRESSTYMKYIFTLGGCYKLHLFLKKLFPECVPMLNEDKTHVVTAYRGYYFDINGIVAGEFYPVTDQDLQVISQWSFEKNYLLQIAECEACGEPFVF